LQIEHPAVKPYWHIHQPIFNFQNNFCQLSFDFICPRQDECGFGEFILLKKEKEVWKMVDYGG